MRISPAGAQQIKSYEGCKLTAYQCSAGRWTIGYGSTKGVKAGDEITQEEADRRFFEVDLPEFEKYVNYSLNPPIGEKIEVTQNQFDALVSLCYNIGPSNYQSSSVVRKMRLGDFAGAADSFLLFNKVRDNKTGKLVFSKGLDNRRKKERDLFLKG